MIKSTSNVNPADRRHCEPLIPQTTGGTFGAARQHLHRNAEQCRCHLTVSASFFNKRAMQVYSRASANSLCRATMHGLTDYITECNWEDVFTLWFVWLDDLYTELYGQQHLRQRGTAPVFSDSEVITVSLVIDAYFHGDEELGVSFVRPYHLAFFPKLLSRSRFNRRRRALISVMEHLRRLLSDRLIAVGDDWRLIDSAPLPVCTYQRSRKNATLAGPEYYSVMPCRRAKLFGLRLLMTTNLEQVVDQWLLVPAAPRDSKRADVLLEDAAALHIIGDNAFHDPTVDHHLREARQIQMIAPPRTYDKIKWPASLRQDFNRVRRRIESAFSVLATVFHIQLLGARSLTGIGARVATRILAYTLSFLTQPALDTLNN